jgi:predicted GNAT family acetyltransferase
MANYGPYNRDYRGRFDNGSGYDRHKGRDVPTYRRPPSRQSVTDWADITSSHGDDSGSYVVTDKQTGNQVGRMGYNRWKTGDVMVNGLRVQDAYQRRGVAKAMLERLAHDFPNATIQPGPLSKDGSAIYNALKDLPGARVGKPMTDFMTGGTPVGRRS